MYFVKTTPRDIPYPNKLIFALAALLFLSGSCIAQLPMVEENSQDVQVKYLAADNDAMFFNLRYDNQSGNDFKLMVLNETGEVLFQNNYSGKKFRKRIRLTRLTDTDGVTFLIRSPNRDVQLSRQVKVPGKVVDDASLEDN